MTRAYAQTLLIMIGLAVAVAVVVAGLVYAGGSRRARRYRPGRPFVFTPVWFLASPERQPAARGAAGGAVQTPEKALPAQVTHQAHHGETGGASDRW